MNKSLITNFLSAILIPLGLNSPYYGDLILKVGLFATSGAITNWLAIHMLFEKIPGLYGSGIIPLRFEAFKEGIKSMMMNEFFSEDNLEKFVQAEVGAGLKIDEMFQDINYDLFFDKLKDVVITSPLGGMLSMFGGAEALEPMRAPFAQKMEEGIKETLSDDDFQKKLSSSMGHSPSMVRKIEEIVDQRLDELTPQMVKEIVQKMIKEHLGWLVVWGGIFGGLFGVLSYFL